MQFITNMLTVLLISIIIICLLYGCRRDVEGLENKCDQHTTEESCKDGCVWQDDKCVMLEYECPYKDEKTCNEVDECEWMNGTDGKCQKKPVKEEFRSYY